MTKTHEEKRDVARNTSDDSYEEIDLTGDMSIPELWTLLVWLPEKPKYLSWEENKTKGRKKVWYKTQQEHWIGWIGEYEGPGGYNRKGGKNRNAEYAYNHLLNPDMLLWLGDTAGLAQQTIEAAFNAFKAAPRTCASQCSVIRKKMPWNMVQTALRKIELTDEQMDKTNERAREIMGLQEG